MICFGNDFTVYLCSAVMYIFGHHFDGHQGSFSGVKAAAAAAA
jgi:hypothetical protein